MLPCSSSRAAARCAALDFTHLADGCMFAGNACLLGLQAVFVAYHLTLLTAVYTSSKNAMAVLAGVCLAAMALLEFGKPVWVWVGLCVALATWQKKRWNSTIWGCSGSCRHLQHVRGDHALSHLCGILAGVSLAGNSNFAFRISRCGEGDGELGTSAES